MVRSRLICLRLLFLTGFCAVFLAGIALLAPAKSIAQGVSPPESESPRRQPLPEAPGARKPGAEPPAAETPPARPQSRAERLEKLYARLNAASDEAEAKGIVAQIDRIFERSGSDTADLLVARARTAAEAKEFDTALDLLDFVITLQPSWAEAYHRRAMVHYLRRDEEAAMRDLRAVLVREPRHVSALSGLAAILKSLGREKDSYLVTRRLLELYPANSDAKTSFDRMKTEIEGQGI